MIEAEMKMAVKELKQKLVERFGRKTEIYLFGSAARGDFGPFSDIDVLVLIPFEVNNSLEEEVFDLAYDVELKCGVVFGVVVYSKEFWNSPAASFMPLHKNIEKEGIAV